MSDAVVPFDESDPDESTDLWRRYEAAMAARANGSLPGFSSEEEFLAFEVSRQ